MAHILVIEDEDSVRLVIRQILTRDGHTVVEAKNGKDGIDVFFEQAPDMIVTDIIMPEQEGIEVILEIKRTSPPTKILAISGGGHWHDRDFCLRAAQQLGADGTLKKPFTRNELLAEINSLLRMRQEI